MNVSQNHHVTPMRHVTTQTGLIHVHVTPDTVVMDLYAMVRTNWNSNYYTYSNNTETRYEIFKTSNNSFRRE